MNYNKPFKINRRRKKNIIVPVLLALLFAVLISLAIAAVWQATSGDQEKIMSDAASAQNPALQSSLAQESENAGEGSSREAPAESLPAPESSVPEESSAVQVEGAVPASERVTSSYFDDAVFVGDSITSGIELYGVMANTDVLAGTGINLDTIYSSPVVKLEDGSRITIMDGLKKKQYNKVYVLLGGNEVRDVEKTLFISRYGKVLDDIKASQPDALLYVQSILPVTEDNNYHMVNTRIDEYNVALVELCKQKAVYYLNVAECMKDENGMLPQEASPVDGMHFGTKYYDKWFEYLKKHTVASQQ